MTEYSIISFDNFLLTIDECFSNKRKDEDSFSYLIKHISNTITI